MRPFVALPLDPDLRAAVRAAIPAASPGTRPADERDLHVTLHSWETGISRRHGPPCESSAWRLFRIVVEGTGTFVGRDGDVFGWAGVEASPELVALHAAVAEALAPVGFVPEARPYVPT